jgi:hypothetical protein
MNRGAGTILWHGADIPALLPGVEFKADGHEYTVDSSPWPSVTGYLNDDRYDNGDNTAALWGESAHDHAFHLVKGTLNRSMVTDPRMVLTLQGFEAGLKHFGVTLPCGVLAEYIVYSKRFHFIGRFDFLFSLGNHDLLLDLKTGASSKRASRQTGLQLGGYAHGIIEHKLSTMTRLRLAELNVQLDGTWWPETFNTKKVMNVFLAAVSYKNYYNNI